MQAKEGLARHSRTAVTEERAVVLFHPDFKAARPGSYLETPDPPFKIS
jgi:hypothetical protein